MNVIDAEDTLEPLGILAGVFLVLVGIGTLVGTPWTTSNSILVSALQLLGVAAAILIGVGLVVLSYTGE